MPRFPLAQVYIVTNTPLLLPYLGYKATTMKAFDEWGSWRTSECAHVRESEHDYICVCVCVYDIACALAGFTISIWLVKEDHSGSPI